MNVTPLGPRRAKRNTAKQNSEKINTEKISSEKISIGVMLLLGVFFTILTVAVSYWPALVFRPANTTGQTQIYYMGRLHEESGHYEQGIAYLPLTVLKECIDPAIYWDVKNKLVIVTTGEDLYHFPLNSKAARQNLETYEINYPLIQKEHDIYLPVELVEKLYDVTICENKTESVMTISDKRLPVQQGRVINTGKLRVKPNLRAAWSAQVEAAEEVSIFTDENGWYWIETLNGTIGYIPKSNVNLSGISKRTNNNAEAFKPWNPSGEQILLTWEFVGSKTVNPAGIGELGSVDVLSPTWFWLEENGIVSAKADLRYVQWAHQQGRQVWGVFSNNCRIDLTHTFLNDSLYRTKAIEQLLDYLDRYQLDGLDVDFEYMYLEDKEHYVQFVRELAPLLHARGKVLNLSIIFHSSSENWSMCYDHKKLGEIADYLTVMAYDENTALAGSTASLPWVQSGLERMIEDVPSEKLLLGIPLYTRLWKVATDAEGKEETTRQTFTMDQAEKWMAENKTGIIEDPQSGQHYVEITADSVKYRMWLEDAYSIEKRVELMKKYRLAGLAVWRRGLEKEGVWTDLSGLLNKRW